MIRFRSIALLLMTPLAFMAIGVSRVAAVAVSGWQADQLTANTSPGLMNANTNSPIWGTGVEGSTNNSAIWASIPDFTLSRGRKLTLTATVNFVGSDATNEQFRFGLLNNNGSSKTAGWLGYLAQNSTGGFLGELSAKNPLGQDFATSSWASILGTPLRAIALATAIDPQQNQFFAGTYELRLSITRAGDALNLGLYFTAMPKCLRCIFSE